MYLYRSSPSQKRKKESKWKGIKQRGKEEERKNQRKNQRKKKKKEERKKIEKIINNEKTKKRKRGWNHGV